MNRLEDQQGHLWPITGQWCSVCGMPIDPITAPTHPGCEGEQR